MRSEQGRDLRLYPIDLIVHIANVTHRPTTDPPGPDCTIELSLYGPALRNHHWIMAGLLFIDTILAENESVQAMLSIIFQSVTVN